MKDFKKSKAKTSKAKTSKAKTTKAETSKTKTPQNFYDKALFSFFFVLERNCSITVCKNPENLVNGQVFSISASVRSAS